MPSKPLRPFVRKRGDAWFIFMDKTQICYGGYPYATHRDAMYAARRIALREANR